MALDDAPGWYGKLAMLGDFASRRLAPDWVRRCDQWLSDGLRTSREALGEGWQSVYLSAPAWRFVWGPGIVDAQWWFGVLMPSCDSVGRYYPLVIAQPRAQPPADRIALDHLDLWWRHVAQAGLATLGEGAALETFEDALAHAPPWPSGGRGTWVQAQAQGSCARWQLAPGLDFSELAGGLAAAYMTQLLNGGSAWWPMTGPGAAGSCCLLPGLPPATLFADMLAAQW